MRASRLAVSMVLALVALVIPTVAQGQAPGKVYRVGIIHLGGVYVVMVEGLQLGLRELGLEEGKHVVLDVRDTRGDLKAVEAVARELERAKVDLLYTVTTSVTTAAKRAAAQVPIVFHAGTDPVAAGLVESVGKPGGRLTGIHGRSVDLTAKRLELLKEILPGLHRVVTFYNPGNATAREAARLARDAARQLNVQVVERHVGSAEELRRGLQGLKLRDADAYFQVSDSMVISQAPLIIAAAKAQRLPTMFSDESLVAQGVLVSYGQSYREIGRLLAKYVQKVLSGTSPKDIPVESYDKIEFVLNLRTAREIGLTIPPSVRFRADRVIE